MRPWHRCWLILWTARLMTRRTSVPHHPTRRLGWTKNSFWSQKSPLIPLHFFSPINPSGLEASGRLRSFSVPVPQGSFYFSPNPKCWMKYVIFMVIACYIYCLLFKVKTLSCTLKMRVGHLLQWLNAFWAFLTSDFIENTKWEVGHQKTFGHTSSWFKKFRTNGKRILQQWICGGWAVQRQTDNSSFLSCIESKGQTDVCFNSHQSHACPDGTCV